MSIDWEGLVIEGIEAGQMEDQGKWHQGDLALQVETRYGNHSLKRYAEAIGVEYKTLLDRHRVLKAFQKSERSEILRWSHHQVFASRDDRRKWLVAAEAERWTIPRLRDAILDADYETISNWETGDLVALDFHELERRTRIIVETMKGAAKSIAQSEESIAQLGHDVVRHFGPGTLEKYADDIGVMPEDLSALMQRYKDREG